MGVLQLKLDICILHHLIWILHLSKSFNGKKNNLNPNTSSPSSLRRPSTLSSRIQTRHCCPLLSSNTNVVPSSSWRWHHNCGWWWLGLLKTKLWRNNNKGNWEGGGGVLETMLKQWWWWLGLVRRWCTVAWRCKCDTCWHEGLEAWVWRRKGGSCHLFQNNYSEIWYASEIVISEYENYILE